MNARKALELAAFLSALLFIFVMFGAGTTPRHEHRVTAGADGLLTVSPVMIERVRLSQAGRQFDVRRVGGDWQDLSGSTLNIKQAKLIERCLRFMANAAPVRTIAAEDTLAIDRSLFGFSVDAIAVELHAGQKLLLAFQFGHEATDPSLQFMRVAKRDDIYVMSRFVGAAWQQLASSVATEP